MAIDELERVADVLGVDLADLVRTAQSLKTRLAPVAVATGARALAPAEGLEPSTCRLTAHFARSARMRRQLLIVAHGSSGVEAVTGDLGHSVRVGGHLLSQGDLVSGRAAA